VPDDPAFVERLRAGDREACALCVREHSTHVYNLALKLTGDPAAAEDGVDTVSIDEPVENEPGLPEPREFADWSENPEALLLDAELRRAMDEAAASLSETLRSVFVLRDVNGLSTAQTAEVLGLSEEAVKSRLLRARLALREKLAGYMSGRAAKVQR